MGLLAKPDMINFGAVEEEVKKQSKAVVKSQKKDQVKFDPKKKGIAPTVSKGILQFSCTGTELKEDDLAALLTNLGYTEL